MKTIVLGPEYDDALKSVVMAVIRELGGKVLKRMRGSAGSQDVQIVDVDLAGQRIVIEAETYIGLSVIGPEALVEKIAEMTKARQAEGS